MKRHRIVLVPAFLARFLPLSLLIVLAACTEKAVDEADSLPPSVPTGVQATAASANRIDLQWSASTDDRAGVANYRVHRMDVAATLAIVTTTSYQDNSVAPATSYTYFIEAVDAAVPPNVSGPSLQVTATTPALVDTTPPTIPVNLSATPVGATRIDIRWDPSTDTGGSGLANYQVFRNGSATPIATVTTNGYSDVGLVASTTYTYTVRAADGAGNLSSMSASVSATTTAPPDTTAPAPPTNLLATAQGAGTVLLMWTATTDPSGIQRYEIRRDGAALSQVAGNVTQFVDSTTAPSTTYSYTVRAVDGAGNASGFSNAANATTPPAADTTPPTVPANLTATAISSEAIRLNWGASTDTGGSGVAGYRVFRGATQITEVGPTVLTFTDNGRTPSTQYSYTVRAFDGDGNVSGPSNQATTTTPADTTAPQIPTALVATANGSTRIDLSWNAVTDSGGSGLQGYRIFRNSVQIPGIVMATTFADTGRSANTTYNYTVRAVDNAGNASVDSVPASATTAPDTIAPSAPSGLNATPVGSTRVDLSWTASTDTGGSGLAGYRVFRDGIQIATGIVPTTYSDTTAVSSTTYAYVVRALDGAGNISAASNTANATTPATGVSGLDTRPSNTTCLAPNQPTTNTSVALQIAFPGQASFSAPILLLQEPGDSTRWYVVEQRGTVQRFNVSTPATKTLWADLQSIVDDSAQEAGLLGMAFHPNYASNGRVFVSFTSNAASPFRSHISEFHRGANGLLDPATRRDLLTLDQPFDNHNGGNILFGPDGNLYIGFGDGGSGGDPGNRSQNRNLLFGKILRINVDGAQPYVIPADNPFAGNPLCNTGAGSTSCPEIYAYGFRNPWRWSFDRASSEPELWMGDVGQDAFEEVDRVVLGGNYGWRIREGFHCFSPMSGCATTNNGVPLLDPVAEYDHGVGQSITGGYVYRGNAIPSLRGHYVFADFESGRMMHLASNASGGYDRLNLLDSGINPSSFAEDSMGELYVVNYGGNLQKLVPGTGTIVDTIPANLIDTGCVSTADPTLPASGLIPYAPNAPFWSDGAVKDRWMALPNGQTITIQASGDWDFPDRTVLMKHFRLGGRLIETRLFMRHPDTHNWGGYTYEWNAAQTAATLVRGGEVVTITPPGQDWIYPSEVQCLQCHTNAAGRSLGLETAQLNGSLLYPTTGRTANQLDTLNTIGMFTTPLSQPPSALPAYRDPYGAAGTLTERARAYLHTNCAQCHRPSGPTPSNMDLRFSTAIGSTNTCNVAPNSGNLGIANARLIQPGNAAQSLIWVRMSRRDAHQMPPLGSNLVDTAGAALIQTWINGLNATCQ